MSKRVWIINMIMAFLLCHVLTAQATSYRAVCVGISDYPGTGNDLPDDCVNDAVDMKNYLVWYQGWSSGNIRLSTNSDATEGNITGYIGAMPNSTGNSELFFYSGHGNENGLFTYSGTLAPSELQSAFGSNFNQYCCFLNACESGIFVNQMSKGEISSACEDDEYAYTGGPDDNCVYSYYVLEGIKDDQADPESGHVVSAKEVHDYAAPKTTQYNSSMHPQFRGNLGVLNLATLGPTTSGTLIDSELWDQNVTLSGTVTVPSDKILAIYDRTVSLNGYYIKCTGSGKIVRSGNATFNPTDINIKSGSDYKGQYSTFQQAWDNVASGQAVYLDSDTYTGDIDMKPNVCLYGKGEDYTTINGRVNFDGDDYASIEAVQVNQKISVLNSDFVHISVKAGSSDCYLDISGSWVDVDYITSTVSRSRGIYAHDYSDLSVWGGEMTHKSLGIDLYLGTDAVTEGVYFCQNSYDISADQGCSADAWSCNFSSSEEGGSVLGNVSWDSWNWCGMQKRAATNANAASGGNNNLGLSSADSNLSEYREAMSIYHTIKRNLRQEQKSGESVNPKKYAPEFASALEKFKQVVANYPGSAYVISSLGRIATSYRALNDFAPLEDYMQKIANDTELNHLRPYALSALIPFHVKKKDYGKAIELSDQIIQEFHNDPIVCELTYGKGLIYKYFLNDAEKAKEMFTSVVSQCPDHKTAQSAKDELEHSGLAKDSAEEQEPVELSVQNYPNPFNPETRFQFTLPEPGRVVLKIFDIWGREVKTLIDADKLAGSYMVAWDGKNSIGIDVASGMYFYQIRFNGQTLINRMLLLR